jgi:hypothetical protein
VQNRLIASVLGFGLVLLISGCVSAPPQKIEISARPIERPELVLPKADGLDMREADWIIITPENYEEVISKLTAERKSVALFALTDKGYQALALNINDLRTHIQQLNAIIVAYEGYYADSNSALDAANEEINNVNKQIDGSEQPQERKKILGLF